MSKVQLETRSLIFPSRCVPFSKGAALTSKLGRLEGEAPSLLSHNCLLYYLNVIYLISYLRCSGQPMKRDCSCFYSLSQNDDVSEFTEVGFFSILKGRFQRSVCPVKMSEYKNCRNFGLGIKIYFTDRASNVFLVQILTALRKRVIPWRFIRELSGNEHGSPRHRPSSSFAFLHHVFRGRPGRPTNRSAARSTVGRDRLLE